MLNEKGFDLWAEDYDTSVAASNEDNSYPFAGYNRVLRRIAQTVLQKLGAAVLDIGFGTGTLTAHLYEKGCAVWGQDFSAKMIALAQAKMPNAHLYQGDFTKGLVPPLLQNRYHFITATYSLHHLTLAQKVSFLQSLLPLLEEGGQVLIGDIAFTDASSQTACRAQAGEEWDPDEFYFVYDELLPYFPQLRFEAVSHCAGILALSK